MTFQKLKKLYIEMRYKNVFFSGKINILGKLPHFKIPKNGIVEFGNNVVLNSDFANTNTALTYRCKFVTGYEGKITVGENTMFNGVCVVSYKEVEIGANCQIASSTIIADTNFHPVDPIEREKQVTGQDFSFSSVKNAQIKIGNNVWIGWNCTVLKGVEIGDNCIVAAGSVVTTGVYLENSIIAGNPAKVVKKI
ncbi:acyltransferase [Colwellia sp. 75C3]|uniref:acyltransferase n=1 Tax=Colwellia sp. 75C3 TaxID=888425 RepID=UPI000C32F38E|nr:acyltransferase [Colwellia sp. 75C3]PKG82238.1 acyltransferase [Colwellia sp. 75C3]